MSSATPQAKAAFCVFEALRRMGWPARMIFFINAIDWKTCRQAAFVCLQRDEKSPPLFSYNFAWLDETPDALTNLQANIARWNRDAAWRAQVWSERAALGFDDVRFVEVLVMKGLNVGPERAS